MTPEATWAAITEQLAAVAARVADAALTGYVATPNDIDRWHRTIFEPWFPKHAGRRRVGDEQVQFDVVWGGREAPVPQTIVSCKGRNVSTRLRRTFGPLGVAIAERDRLRAEGRRRMLRETTLQAAAFYAKLIVTHPFCDGNGRVAHVALQYALLRLGASAVALPNHDEQQWALGQALRPGGRHHDYAPLAALLERTIRASTRS